MGLERIAAHEHHLLELALTELAEIPQLQFIGQAADRSAVISFAVEGAHFSDVATLLDLSGIAVRSGTHCAEPLMQRFGITGTARASFAVYNDESDVIRLKEGLQKAPSHVGNCCLGGADGPRRAARTHYRWVENRLRSRDPVDVYNLGLIYQVDVDEEAKASIRMTLTAPNCPAAELLPGLVEQTAREVDGISEVRVDLVFDPPWDKDLMSPAARLKLGMM